MKKRFLALLLAVCILIPVFALPAVAASNSNTAIQTARMLGIISAQQSEDLDSAVTRGEFAQMLTSASAYRDSIGDSGVGGTLFPDVGADSAQASYIRIAVQNGWMSGYTDGTFRPDEPVTLEVACAAVLKMLGYQASDLVGIFPSAQLNKASELGLRSELDRRQGEMMTRADCAVLIYNALLATTKAGQTYGSSLGLTIRNGQIDTSSALRASLEGPFIADLGEVLSFTPSAIYRNGEVSQSASLSQYDVYYYSESLNTVWIYTKRAAGRITAVSPSASAPTAVTVAGQSYTIGSTNVAYQISVLSGGGVGQIVTLLLGMDDEVVGIITGEDVNTTYYGVVQSATRSLVTQDGADVMQTVSILCTDGEKRSFQIHKDLNYLEGWLISAHSSQDGVVVDPVNTKSISGYFDAKARTLGDYKLADDVHILDAVEGSGKTVRLDRLDGVTLASSDIRYYVLNDKGEISDLILNDVTGDVWTYGCLTGATDLQSSSNSSIIDPNAVLSGIVSGLAQGSLLEDIWSALNGSTGKIFSAALGFVANRVDGLLGDMLGIAARGAQYTYLVGSSYQVATTDIKYPILAGGIGVRYESDGNVRAMVQLMPVRIDSLGAGVAMVGNKQYALADDIQVYLWHRGVYYPTTFSSINAEDYYITGWYDNSGRAAGGQIRILMALKKD